MSRRMPVLLSLTALGLAALTLPGAAAADRDGPARSDCAADSPAVKTLVAAVDGLKSALPDPVKTQVALGVIYDAITGAQEAACLPSLPTAPPSSKAVDECLAPTVTLMSAVLGGVSTTLTTPPDAAALTAATGKLGEAVKAMNDSKCLPVPLTVPGQQAVLTSKP
jgi:hypothetical protein